MLGMCLGVVNCHNNRKILGRVGVVWDWFLVHYIHSVLSFGGLLGFLSILLCKGPPTSNVAKLFDVFVRL